MNLKPITFQLLNKINMLQNKSKNEESNKNINKSLFNYYFLQIFSYHLIKFSP